MGEETTGTGLPDLADKLCRVAGRLVDPVIRRHYVVRRLLDLDDNDVAEVLHLIFKASLEGHVAAKAVVASGLDAELLAEHLGRERCGRIYHAAARRDYQEVCNLFRTIRPAKSPEGDEDSFLKYGLPNLTIGERMSAARSRDENLLNRVSFDPEPVVIRQLLQNPRVIEKLVIRIAARRPNRPEILEEIYREPRWRARPEVRLSLVRNPYTPPRLALALLPTLKRRELKDVLFDGMVHPEVRSAAETVLEARRKVFASDGGNTVDEAATDPED